MALLNILLCLGMAFHQINSIIYCISERSERWHNDISTEPSLLSPGGLKAVYVYTYIPCPGSWVSLAKSQDMVGLSLHTDPFDPGLMEWNSRCDAADFLLSLCCQGTQDLQAGVPDTW